MGGYSRLEGPSTDRAYPNMIEEVRFAPDSALEGEGFEPSVPLAKQSASMAGREAPTRSNGQPEDKPASEVRRPVPYPKPIAE